MSFVEQIKSAEKLSEHKTGGFCLFSETNSSSVERSVELSQEKFVVIHRCEFLTKINIIFPIGSSAINKNTSNNTDHAEPDSPATYIVQSNTPMSFKAQNTPLEDTMARNPPPDPRIATVGTWKSDQRYQFKKAILMNNFLGPFL